MIGVKNCSGKTLKARYDGQDYTFVADEKVTTPLSEDAARHIFGYGDRDKTNALLRLGWLRAGTDDSMDAAIAILNSFKFLQVEMQAVEEPAMPRSIREDVAINSPASGAPLSAEEEAIASGMNIPMLDPKPEGSRFANATK